MRELGRYPDFLKLLVGQGVSEIGSVATLASRSGSRCSAGSSARY